MVKARWGDYFLGEHYFHSQTEREIEFVLIYHTGWDRSCEMNDLACQQVKVFLHTGCFFQGQKQQQVLSSRKKKKQKT